MLKQQGNKGQQFIATSLSIKQNIVTSFMANIATIANAIITWASWEAKSHGLVNEDVEKCSFMEFDNFEIIKKSKLC